MANNRLIRVSPPNVAPGQECGTSSTPGIGISLVILAQVLDIPVPRYCRPRCRSRHPLFIGSSFGPKSTMKLTTPAGLIALFVTAVLGQGQQFPECTRELLRTDECAAVVNPSACYNQFRWNTRTLGCIDGTNDAERKKRVRGASA